YAALLLAALLALAPAPFGGRALADTAGTSAAESSGDAGAEADAVASEEELSSRKEVGREGMEPVTADQLENGSWPIEVDTDTSMFRVADAILMVDNGTMTAKLTLGGKGYEKLYMGTAEEAAAAADADCAFYEENADGSFAYTVAVPVLNAEVDCAAWSIRKEKWYGHKIVFEADTLPEGAVKKLSAAWTEEAPAAVDKKDGTYTVNVTLTGGTGKASVTSPAKVTVQGNTATAEIAWSSPNYDYMVAGGQKYLPVNSEGNSVFSIPITAFDAPVTVLADTTAMSVPHEIEYQLVFDSASLAPEQSEAGSVPLHLGMILLGGVCGLIWIRSRRKNTL
ncbi:MAG: hypothetical protein J6N19_01855, partial [Clostridium sp.]|nr:hypothetical protein [Clostridium sp.]